MNTPSIHSESGDRNMKVVVHHLAGCSPLPLAHYLKALGVLRLVAEQKDPGARLWWQDEHAVLACRLDEEELMQFFLQQYRPTPLIAPWNGGSGFYPGDNQKPVASIVASSVDRLAAYKQAIALASGIVGNRAEQPIAGTEKDGMLQELRRKVRGPLATWIDCAVVLDGEGSPSYPSLLGTGGNDGRLDFTLNFMQHLDAVISFDDVGSRTSSTVALKAALFSREPFQGLEDGAIGQFLPGMAGGANATTGYSGDSAINSWDYILMLEGALLFEAGLSRRVGTNQLPLAAAPFAMRGESAGHGTAAPGEEAPRGEQWLPLWRQPTTYLDVRRLFAEGRFALRERPVCSALDAARAVGRLGVARGVSAFERIAFLERNGRMKFAIPLARWPVRVQTNRSLVDWAAGWTDRLSGKVVDEQTPASWKASARRCEEALLACCRNGRDAACWQELLLTMGSAEAVLAQTPEKADKTFLRPLSNLPGEWVEALPNTPELRLALSLAGLVGTQDDETGTADYQHPVRIHFVPFPWDYEWKRWNFRSFAKSGPEVVANSGDLIRDAIAILRRRLEGGRLSLRAGHGHYAAPTDIAAFLRGELDDALILAMARPLMALAWKDASRLAVPVEGCAQDDGVMNLYGLLRLTHLPTPLELPGKEPFRIRTDPAILARLLSGDAAAAFAMATRRLGASGLRPHLRTAVADGPFARRLATSLIFPVHPEVATHLAGALCHPLFVS
jgi:CRISPR-associated protein Csx17